MTVPKETIDRLASIPYVSVSQGVPLSLHTRFGIGGPADAFVEAATEQAFAEALRVAQASGAAYSVIGDGTNLIVSDRGFDGIVLRLTAQAIERESETVLAAAGAELQALVEKILKQVCAARSAQQSAAKTQSFRPGRPTPTHRYAAAK